MGAESEEPRCHLTIKLLDHGSEYSLSAWQVHLTWCLYIRGLFSEYRPRVAVDCYNIVENR